MAWYDYLYYIEDGELNRAQSFSKQHALIKKGKSPQHNRGRLFVAFANFGIILNTLRAGPWENLFIMATCWCLWSVFFASLLGILLAHNPSWTMRKAPNVHACHHLCYTLMLFMTPIVVLIYWIFVHKDHVQYMRHKHKYNEEMFEIAYFHSTYLVHTIPGISALYLMFTTDCVLIKRHSFFLVVFGVAYCIFNWYSCLQRGRPIYWFLNW